MEQIKQSTLDFLSDLKRNNERDWFIKNRKRYDDARMNYEAFVQAVINEISKFDPIIKQVSTELGWDWRLIAAIIYHESRFNENAGAWTGAYGLMQLMPSTAETFGVTDLADLGGVGNGSGNQAGQCADGDRQYQTANGRPNEGCFD